MSKQTGTGGGRSADGFEIHRQMVIALFVATLVVCSGMVIGLIVQKLTVLMVVGTCGAIGGFVSALRRLYSFKRVFPMGFFKEHRRFDLYLVVYSMIPSLVGLIAACILYMVFASGMISGELFPAFGMYTVDLKLSDFDNFVRHWQPVAQVDYAKAVVWGFIAGFSERFVPDLLGRLAAQSDGSADSSQK